MKLEAFKTTVIPLREKMLHISRRLIEDQDDAEDIVQEVFLKLWYIREKLDEYKSVEALAVTMTKNLTLDKIKSRKQTEDESHLKQIDSGFRNPAEELEEHEAVDCIRKLIEALPNLQRIIIRMKDIEGYELSEIADITGTQIESVRSNLSRARKRVREQYLKLTMESQK